MLGTLTAVPIKVPQVSSLHRLAGQAAPVLPQVTVPTCQFTCSVCTRPPGGSTNMKNTAPLHEASLSVLSLARSRLNVSDVIAEWVSGSIPRVEVSPDPRRHSGSLSTNKFIKKVLMMIIESVCSCRHLPPETN